MKFVLQATVPMLHGILNSGRYCLGLLHAVLESFWMTVTSCKGPVTLNSGNLAKLNLDEVCMTYAWSC